MQSSTFLDVLPIWTIFPITLVIGVLAVEGGRRIATLWRRRAKDKPEAPAPPIVAATLGLLAFLLAFTFSMAASRFEERKQAVLTEANAIQTSYLRAATLPEPMSADSRNLLRDYVEVRLAGVRPEQLQQAIVKSEELHRQLWSQAVAAAQKERSPMTSLFMQSLNDVINLHEKRVMAGIHNRVPGAIWIGLYLLLVLAMAVMGYYEGTSGMIHSLAVFGMVLAFSTVFGLIADLDRPSQGLLQVNQQAMLDVQRSMRSMP
jgi:hypothetical protein